jgi:peptidoglycan/LPS O-acetylase OafA/YrhL
MENRTIPALDFVRFFAAAIVMWFHLAYWSWAGPGRITAEIAAGSVSIPQLAGTAQWGWVGVQIFFVISGFVICYSATGKTAGEFAVARFLRLYPAVWICGPITLGILFLCGRDGLVEAFLNTMALSPRGPWVDGVYWTLGIEMAFYGLVWLLLLFRRTHLIQPALIGIGLPSAIIWHLTGHRVIEQVGFTRFHELLLLKHGCYFALGGLMFLSIRDGSSALRTAAMLFFAAACLVEIGRVPTGANLTAALVWSGAVLSMWFGSSNWAAQMPSWRWARICGLATYPLYLIHDVAGAAILRWTPGLPDLLALAVAVASVVGLCFALLPVERRLREMLRNSILRAAAA